MAVGRYKMAKRQNQSSVIDLDDVVKKKHKLTDIKATINGKYLNRAGDTFKGMREDWRLD